MPTSISYPADSTTASNGLTLVGKDVRLGGTLSSPTTITTSATNTLAIAGLQGGASTDSFVTVNNSGVLRQRSVSDVVANSAWSLNGNSGTDGGLVNNFMGTLDDKDLVLRANSPNAITALNVSNFVLGSSSNPFTMHEGRNIDNIGSSTTQWRRLVSTITENSTNTINQARLIGSTQSRPK